MRSSTGQIPQAVAHNTAPALNRRALWYLLPPLAPNAAKLRRVVKNYFTLMKKSFPDIERPLVWC
ncbi:hypothetical protein Z948_127 [Sulfitobacter donghicola DSW-25 = KCTC 12864 = JCM 14565]|nr:hypothetical protein Z948_127 [Sulfitobacter donghicola DSW-25 = KCTC 12864 = JCM 14565]